MSNADYLELQNMPRAMSPASSTHEALSNVSSQPLHRVDGKDIEGETNQWTGRMDTERFLAIVALGLCYVGSQINTFFTGPGIDCISDALHLGSETTWFANSGSLATACIVPCAGYLQDLIGRRGSLAFGLGCTLVGTLICALADSYGPLIAGTVLSGVGSGIQELTAIAAISELVPAGSRGYYLGAINAMSVPFTPAVLYVSEICAHLTWRWLFWIILMWNGLATGMTAITYFRMKLQRPRSDFNLDVLKHLDYLGILLFVGGCTEILIALQAGGQSHNWDSAYVIVQLLVGNAAIGLLIWWESFDFRWRQPLFPFRMFKGQRVVGLTYIICFFSGMPYSAALNLGTTINQYVWQFPPLKTGIIAFGPSFGLLVGAYLGNSLLSVFKGHAREVLVGSAIVMIAFTGAESVISPENSTLWAVLGSFSSVGIGAVLVPLSTVVTLACPDDLIGTAVALVITMRTFGGSVGYAIFYNIFTTTIEQKAPPAIAKATDLKGPEIKQLVEIFTGESSEAPSKAVAQYGAKTVAAAQHAFQVSASQGAALVFYVAIPLGFLALLPAVFLPNMKKYLSKRVLTRSRSTKHGHGTV